MKVKTFVILALVMAAVMYLMGAFIASSFNIGTWTYQGRLGLEIIYIIAVIFFASSMKESD